MKTVGFIVAFMIVLSACDTNRVFEKNISLEDQLWLINNKPSFDFVVTDTASRYNLYCNIRNEVSYPKSNIYFTYYLTDTTGKVFEKKLISEFLFDKKTGKPFGKTALGDIYDHSIPILKRYAFKQPNTYRVTFEQFMRADSLAGILAVGLRIEKAEVE